ncbi:MAG TPA: hypothetical protein VFC24_14040 [Casimicrobiaceae bacterium]|nr:hypothetical protein [Casimicrobiaceae bacterium]
MQLKAARADGSACSRVHLCLYLPGLIDRAAAIAPQATRSLAQCIERIAPQIERDGAVALLAPRYGVAKQQDWPLAPLRAAALGLDVGARYWLRATPVLLEAGHDDVRVRGAVRDLDRAQATALVDLLSRHFASDGLAFIAGTPGDWLVVTEHAPALTTRPLATVIGERVRPHLVSGEDAPTWRRWGQEIEMLLHDHPVNGAREQEGRSIVNSVWWQHGGIQPPASSVPVQTWGHDDDLAALAHHVGVPARPLPGDAGAVWQSAPSTTVVMRLEADCEAEAMDARFVQPLLHALDTGRIEHLDLVADGAGKPALRWRVARQPWWAPWRRTSSASLSDVLARLEPEMSKASA